jgi:N-acetylgalactosamine-6-sulfatase
VIGFGASCLAADASKPNIIFILADDMGFGDLHCYGHPYAKTPTLDKLASEGTMFRNFHVTGVTCCPSRTGFMTSKFPATYRAYPADHGFGDRVTVTELLHNAGYRTGHFGKWHIGSVTKPGTYGIDVVNSDKEEQTKRGGRVDPRGRGAHIYDEAIKFIEANKDVPFYINVWDHIPHFPVDPPKAYAEKFKDIKIVNADFYDSETLLGKFDLVRKAGGDVNQHMANYLGEVLAMDDSIARLLAKLDELGLREKTIVAFSSDQGAAPVRVSPELGGAKGKNAKMTKGDKQELRLNMLGYGGEYRGGKHQMYEGGVRVPFIIRWPGHVPAGRVEDKSLISAIDWLPTLCHIAGVTLPATDFDGEDVSDIWMGASHDRTKPLFWKVSNVDSEKAVLVWPWKLFVAGDKGRGRRAENALYDLSTDSGEKRDIAAEHPDVVKDLSAKLSKWNATLPKDYLKAVNKDD